MNHLAARFLTLTLTLALALSGCGIEGVIDSGIADEPAINGNSSGGVTLTPYITDGQNDPGHASAGKLYSGGASCTATLIGSRTVLTAGHCVKTYSGARFTVGGTQYYSQAIYRHPSYGGGNRDDVAVVILKNKVQGVYPTPIATTPPTEGSPITLVGFGKTSEYAKDYGTKRYTTNTIGKVRSTTFSFYGKKNICNGDSGGPTYAWFGGAEVIIGVHSTKSGWCGNGGTDMRVDTYVQWIQSKAGSDVLLQGAGKTIPPPNGKPGEGQSCATKACDAGLTCVEIKSGSKALGSYCYEACKTAGKDPACDGGEVCTNSNKGYICFDAKRPQTGYTNPQKKNTPPTPPTPPKPPSGSVQEGKACAGKTCAAGLACVGVKSSGSIIGRWCMEKCNSIGSSDPHCDGGETCTYSSQGPVCFNVNGKANGYTSPGGFKMMYFPPGQAPVPPGGTTPPPGTPPGTPPSGGSCGDTDESAVFDLLNKERAARGLGAVACDKTALIVARSHSEDMCKRGYFSHTNKKGQAPWDRLKQGGVTFSSAGENIAYGYSTPQAVNKGWMNSWGHRKNMLSSGWTRAAIGLYICGGSTKYWTEVFMR